MSETARRYKKIKWNKDRRLAAEIGLHVSYPWEPYGYRKCMNCGAEWGTPEGIAECKAVVPPVADMEAFTPCEACKEVDCAKAGHKCKRAKYERTVRAYRERKAACG